MVVALLWVVALLNYMDRQMLSTMRDAMAIDISASIMPAAVLIINENAFSLTFLYINTSSAPNAVIAQVKPVAISASCQPVKLLSQSNVFLRVKVSYYIVCKK